MCSAATPSECRAAKSGRASDSTTLAASTSAETYDWSSLPDSILETVAELLDPTSRGVAKHVSRGMKAALDSTTPDDNEMSAEQLCNSVQLVGWASSQRCPWTPDDFLLVAAGEFWHACCQNLLRLL
jgi:hypothetical protein